MNCKKCNKPLKVIGNNRKNGKKHDDWIERQLHKKCWYEELKRKELEWYKKYEEEIENRYKEILNITYK